MPFPTTKQDLVHGAREFIQGASLMSELSDQQISGEPRGDMASRMVAAFAKNVAEEHEGRHANAIRLQLGVSLVTLASLVFGAGAAWQKLNQVDRTQEQQTLALTAAMQAIQTGAATSRQLETRVDMAEKEINKLRDRMDKIGDRR